MPGLAYCAITKPHLWPTDTLQEVQMECAQNLKSIRLKPETRASLSDLQTQTQQILAARDARLRTR